MIATGVKTKRGKKKRYTQFLALDGNHEKSKGVRKIATNLEILVTN